MIEIMIKITKPLNILTLIILSIFISCISVLAQEEVLPPTYEDSSETIEEPQTPKIQALSPLELEKSEVIFKQSTYNINLINPSFSASFYPGGRGANQLVIYTPSYGLHTGTNEFGTEAVVEGNTVTSLSGAD